MSDAIVRTLVRLYLTHRRLLEWMTAAQAKSDSPATIGGVVPAHGRGADPRRGGRRAGRPGCGRAAWLVAAPLPPAVGPLAARGAVGQPAARAVADASGSRRGRARLLRSTARRDVAVLRDLRRSRRPLPAARQLPGGPGPVVAHRTSPTNIGLYLLSAVAARDFGWLGTLDMLDRLEATLATMGRLERFRGHFYNWYDTGDLRPLEPRYVSTVDSGNLAGHLLVLGNACRERGARPLLDHDAFAGIDDALVLAAEAPSALGRRPPHARRSGSASSTRPRDPGRGAPRSAPSPADWAARPGHAWRPTPTPSWTSRAR